MVSSMFDILKSQTDFINKLINSESTGTEGVESTEEVESTATEDNTASSSTSGSLTLPERVMLKMMEQSSTYDKKISDLMDDINTRSSFIEDWQGYLGQARAKDNSGDIRWDYNNHFYGDGKDHFSDDDWSKIEENIRGYLDKLNNDQQMDMVKLNTLGSSRDRCWDAADSSKEKEGSLLKAETDNLKTT